jgi:hypothetical protein
MSTQPVQNPAPVARTRPKWMRPSPLRQFGEVVLTLGIFALLKKLHSEGVLLSGLTHFQFVAALLSVLLGLVVLFHLLGRLLGRRSAARGREGD